MANGTRSRSIAMRWRPLQEKEKRRNKRRREKKSVFIYTRIILPYGKSCSYRVSYIFVRSTVDSINLEITWATYLRLIKHIVQVYFFLFAGRNRATPNRKYLGKLVD